MRRHYEQLQAEAGIKGSANITADTAPPVKPDEGMALQAERQAEVENTGIGGRMEGAGDNVNGINKIFSEKEIRERILSGEQLLTIDIGKQGKHIVGHNNYIEGRSFITIPTQELQKLIKKYAGTGELVFDKNGVWKNQEVIKADKTIGVAVDNRMDEKNQTNTFKLHYGNSGVHAVPKRKE